MISPRVSDALLVGIEASDDAGVYQLSSDTAQIHTADIISPVTADPYLYGQVAAANSLSDVYSMGGQPLTALNLCFFPVRDIGLDTLGLILKGGLDKVDESGALLVGGHTVIDSDLKYGLSVTGNVHPKRIIRNTTARPGDLLVLTKPIGTGVHITACRRGIITDDKLVPVVKMMAMLNKSASEIMVEFNVSACTDITGFGLIGHGLEMARGSNVGIRFNVSLIPVFPDSLELINCGVMTGLTNEIKKFVKDSVCFEDDVNRDERFLFYDPQTSGGLLVAVHPSDADSLVETLRKHGIEYACVIGECFESEEAIIYVSR